MLSDGPELEVEDSAAFYENKSNKSGKNFQKQFYKGNENDAKFTSESSK